MSEQSTTITSRQIEQSWRQHDPRQGRVPAETWRQLRVFKRSLEGPAAAIQRAFDNSAGLKKLVSDYVCKRGTGRARALARLKAKFAGAEFITSGDCFEARWLEPHGPLLSEPREPGETQDSVLTHFALAGPAGRASSMLLHAWSIEVPDHCLGRLLQRSPEADLKKILFAAGLQFMHASASEVLDLIDRNTTFYLGAEDGLFVCRGVKAQSDSGQRYVYGRAKTWISSELVRPDQLPLAAAGDDELTMGDLNLMLARGGTI